MRLTKREVIMLIFLIILAVVFIEYRFVIIPGINRYQQAIDEKLAIENEIQMIDLTMAIAKQNEKKRDDNLSAIKDLSQKYFDQIKMDVLLVRTHDLILEQGLNPLQYQIQQIQAIPLIPEEYLAYELSYELKNLAATYGVISGQIDETVLPEPPSSGVANDNVEQYQISFNARGTYEQLNDYLDAVQQLNRSMVIASLSIVPDTAAVPPAPDITEPGTVPDDTPQIPVDPNSPDQDSQILSIEVTLFYYGIAKMVPDMDSFQQWYREPFTAITYSPFKELPIPVESLPTTTETSAETDDNQP